MADASSRSVAPAAVAPPREGRARLVVVAIRSVVTYLAVGVYVLLVAPPALLVAVVFKWKAVLYVLGHAGVRLGLRLSGIEVRLAGPRPERRQPVVFCANHQSNIDPPVLFAVLHPRLHVLHKAELSKLPLLGRAMRVGGFVAVDRRNREQSFQSISEGAASLAAGNSFLIFPEGTRSRTGDLLPFKKGGFIMAIQAQVPIVPVAVTGGRASMRKGSALVRPVVMSVRLGDPVETTGLTFDDRDRLVEDVRGRIESLLGLGPVARDEAGRSA